jgi:ankyrin repeat protein
MPFAIRMHKILAKSISETTSALLRRGGNTGESGRFGPEGKKGGGDRTAMAPSIDWDAALFAAAQAGDLAKACDALAAGANVNAPNPYNVTPLLEATGQGHLEMARFLIGRGAEIDYTGMPEGSPLTLVAFMGQVEFLRLFLAAGASVNLALPAGGETALHMAAGAGRTEAVKLLLEAGADPNRHAKSGVVTSMFDGGVKLRGETPLHLAAAHGDEEVIRALLLAGGDRAARNADGDSPFNYAERQQRPHGIRDLLRQAN